MSAARLPTRRASVGDRELMAQLAAGNLGALGALHDRYYAAAFGIVTHAGVERGDADDVVQEVFMKLIQLAPRFDGRESARPWILGIAWRMALHRRRGVQRWLRLLEEALVAAPPRAPRSPEDIAASSQEWTSFARRVGCLPTRMQAAFILVEIEGLSGEEAARALGIPVATVWTRLHHARKRMTSGVEGGEP